MDFRQVMATRYSCRRYDSRPLERELLVQCMDAGRLAPSACNSQRWVFVAVDSQEKRRLLCGALFDPQLGINAFVEQIPAFLVLVSHPPRTVSDRQRQMLSREDRSLLDMGIAAQQICLRAASLGLGSIMLGWMDKEAIRRALDIPRDRDIPLVIGLGYPAADEIPRKPVRHSWQEVCRLNSYSAVFDE